jgi:hypothetical protein
MQYNETTNKSGLMQACEFWCGFPDTGITGDTFLKQQFTVRLNAGFEMILPSLLSRSKAVKFDDPNNADQPVGTFNIVSGTHDYALTEDDNGLDILNVVSLAILPTSSATEYETLTQLTLDDPRAQRVMSPNPSDVGVPTHWMKRGNTVYLYPQPNYAATAGVKIAFEREQTYFTTSDTTREPGIPKPFHELLALYASYDWILVNKSDNAVLISRVEARIARKERDLGILNDKRHPTRKRIAAAACTRSR